ncbi:MAG TPA: 2-dehydropantoate 2-reductase, partial [Herpetosiphonaceae bacterium]|nr:2-dehydropantoate 2-reductase [Herpetosiphonaceae bacterium]
MKIGIIGAGGVGGFFGARLARAGYEVVWLARGAHLAAIQRAGLRVSSQTGDLHVAPARASADAAELGPCDLVLITVKLWDTAGAIEAARPLIDGRTTVMSLQNGVQKDELLRELLPGVPLLGGAAYIEAHIAEPGLIVHGGAIQRLVFGPFGGGESAAAAAFLAACQAAGIGAELSGAIEKAIWEKFVFLVGMSGMTSAARLPVGPLRANPATRALLLECMREVVAVARASGVELGADFAERQLARYDHIPATMTSSMHKDLDRGSRLELPWLSGHVAELGGRLGVATPVNRVISAL